MFSKNQHFSNENHNSIKVSILLFFGAFFWFSLYGFLGIPDYWGDAYHNVYMSWLTIQNDWIYTDYKGRHLAWLPLHTYLTGGWMNLFKSYTLDTVHFLNRIIGAGTVMLVYLTSKKLMSDKASLMSAILLLLMPFWILYSNLNMAEGITALLIVGLLGAILYESPLTIFLLTLIGFFSRYEFSFLAGVIGVSLLFTPKYRRHFWIISLAGLLAITLWSTWSYVNTDNFFDWILQKQSNLSDAQFHEEHKNIYSAFISWWIAIPLLPIILWGIIKIYRKGSWEINRAMITLLAVVSCHWIAIFIGQIWFTSYPDPKYFIISIPFSCIVIGYFTMEILNVKVSNLIIFALVGLLEIPFFYFMPFTIDPQIQMGKYLKEHEETFEGQNIWIDFPVAQIESGLEFGHFYTSEILLPNKDRFLSNSDSILIQNLRKHEIKYIVTYNASFSIASKYLNRVDQKDKFESSNIRWNPIYCYQFKNHRIDGLAGIIADIRFQIQQYQTPICIWEIELL